MYIHFISYVIILFNSTHACVLFPKYCKHKLSQFHFIQRDEWKQRVFSKSFVKYLKTKCFGNFIIVLHALLYLKWIWSCLAHNHKLHCICIANNSKNFVSICFECFIEMIAICEFLIWYFVPELFFFFFC